MATKPTLFPADDPRFDPFANEGDLDPGRIEGYSEIVKANDIDKADALRFREQNGYTKEDAFKMVGAGPRKLKYEFAWLPVSNPTGGISPHLARQLDHFTTREGFVLASEELVKEEGFGLPPTAVVAADGTIRRGFDVALYVRSGEVARKWERYKAEKAAEAEGAKLPEAFQKDGYEAPTFREREERISAEVTH